MISLLKLKKLPRHQRLRKILKIIGAAEAELLCSPEGLPIGSPIGLPEGFPKGLPEGGLEDPPLSELVEMLSGDSGFSPPAAAALKEAHTMLKETEAGPEPGLKAARHRALNTVKHILLMETGIQTADWDFLDSGGNLDASKRRIFPGMLLYLEDIRSPFNVGAIFRSAESFGVEKIILSPLCADPEHKRSRRSSMGCVDLVSWQRNGPQPLSELAATGLPVFALETGGTAPADFAFPGQGIMLAGSEELGLSPDALDLAEASLGRLTIPTRGAKASLNVAVAAGIALHAWAAALDTK
jgi:TrmH family RNA methyltransferase